MPTPGPSQACPERPACRPAEGREGLGGGHGSDWPFHSADIAIVRQRIVRYNARMNATLKITKIGNSAGVILPK